MQHHPTNNQPLIASRIDVETFHPHSLLEYQDKLTAEIMGIDETKC